MEMDSITAESKMNFFMKSSGEIRMFCSSGFYHVQFMKTGTGPSTSLQTNLVCSWRFKLSIFTPQQHRIYRIKLLVLNGEIKYFFSTNL